MACLGGGESHGKLFQFADFLSRSGSARGTHQQIFAETVSSTILTFLPL
jgi:hypothetical protein